MEFALMVCAVFAQKKSRGGFSPRRCTSNQPPRTSRDPNGCQTAPAKITTVIEVNLWDYSTVSSKSGFASNFAGSYSIPKQYSLRISPPCVLLIETGPAPITRINAALHLSQEMRPTEEAQRFVAGGS